MLGEGIEAETLTDLHLPVDSLFCGFAFAVEATVEPDKVGSKLSDRMLEIVGLHPGMRLQMIHAQGQEWLVIRTGTPPDAIYLLDAYEAGFSRRDWRTHLAVASNCRQKERYS